MKVLKIKWRLTLLFILIINFSFSQCPPVSDAGLDQTITCGSTAVIGTTVTNPNNPSGTLAPTCTKIASSQNGPLTQGGGIYNNGVVTTGGTTNINNTNTLVDVTHTDPMGPNAWQTLWYSDYTSQYVEARPNVTFHITISAKSINNNQPNFCQV